MKTKLDKTFTAFLIVMILIALGWLLFGIPAEGVWTTYVEVI